jgi:5'-nucleotidase
MNQILCDKNKLNQILQDIKSDGLSQLHLVADFDRTLTKAKIRGDKYASVFGQIRNSDYLGQDYKIKADQLFNKYRPIEIDPNLTVQQKSEHMHQWWIEHFDLAQKSGLTQQILTKVIDESNIQFRDQSTEVLKFLAKNNIPLVIMSAGLTYGVEYLLKRQGLLTNNIHIISNDLEFDEQGKMIRAKEPIIHSMNKHETEIQNQPYFKHIQHRPNVILLGDSLGDLGMIQGFPAKNTLKIGFLNEVSNASISQFTQHFDVVLLDDAPMDEALRILQQVS